MERDFQKQISYAEKVGMKIKALAIASRMVELGYSDEEIGKVTGE